VSARSSADSWRLRLDRLQAAGRLPSVVAGVLQDGELVWNGAVDGGVDAQYRIGSITKTMTAAAVLQLRDEGALALDDPIGRFVAETGYADATVGALLSHTSGMQSEPVGSWWERSPGSDFATLARANDGSGAVAGAGEWFHYSNLGFALLGEAVARLRSAPWWEVVRDRLLAPLDMARTTYDAEPPAAHGRSVDHFAGTLAAEPHQDTGAMAPAGQVWSTVDDLARWARFLADGHRDVLPAATLREMSRVVAPATDYGLGLRVLRHGGRSFVGHTGSMPGFQASLFVDPRARDGVVVLANATTGLDTDGVLEAFLGGPDPDPVARWRPTAAVPPVVAPGLGVWFWGNTAVELRWHNEELQLRDLRTAAVTDTFAVRGGRLVGRSGYHRGEALHVVPRADGTVSHLECATFVYTRVPYDPDAPIPGGVSS
jgi:CubicO group peptidase (beta-lactamase class C family)